MTDKLLASGEEYDQRIEELHLAKAEAKQNLKKKETELYRQKFEIKDLQKTKQVLTHRTNEIKSTLEPREQQIESLKLSLADLEKLFEMHAKSEK